jgi:hypothetical protein
VDCCVGPSNDCRADNDYDNHDSCSDDNYYSRGNYYNDNHDYDNNDDNHHNDGGSRSNCANCDFGS